MSFLIVRLVVWLVLILVVAVSLSSTAMAMTLIIGIQTYNTQPINSIPKNYEIIQLRDYPD
jgi:hypothetical protein